MLITWIFIGIAAMVVLWMVAIFNGLIQLKIRAEGAWSDIDVQLKRRYDLVPNLVETVKGYAGHERKVFEQVTEARSKAMQATNPQGKGEAERGLSSALKSLFAVAENYPQLRASENFKGLQDSLGEIEEAIQNARRYYNAVTRDYNTKLEVIPDRFIGGLAGFKPREFFQPESPAERQPVKVSF
ncbi:MAG: LemA family protein [Candidatus Omnitrophica bacterium]|nr:LemA family protein [Candidatus Omnitrophota bacterium]